jgi:hypothetical protein
MSELKVSKDEELWWQKDTPGQENFRAQAGEPGGCQEALFNQVKGLWMEVQGGRGGIFPL